MKKVKQLMIDIKFGKGKILQLFICLIMALFTFVGLILLQQSLVAPNGAKLVVMARKDIPKNTLIDESNYSTYFYEGNRDFTSISDKAITKKEDIINGIVKAEVLKGDTLSKDDILDKEVIIDDKNIVSFSISVADITSGVGGTLRGGDIVRLGIINETTKEFEIIKETVYIDKALDANGATIEKNSSTPATTFIVLATKEDMKDIESAISVGKIILSKIENLDEIE